jgi:hypothetical protein
MWMTKLKIAAPVLAACVALTGSGWLVHKAIRVAAVAAGSFLAWPKRRLALLDRLRLQPDEESWRQLVDLYAPLIRARIGQERQIRRFGSGRGRPEEAPRPAR